MKSSQKTDNNPFLNPQGQWDYVILTASNEKQAEAYRRQLKIRLDDNLISKSTHWGVISDPNGERVGSGGATLNALKYIRDFSEDREFYKHNKILVIHSGGDSKRAPTYSVCGKLFMPFQKKLVNGMSSALFDELIRSLECVPDKTDSGMLVISGDILVVFDSEKLDFYECDAMALSVNEGVDVGKNHGVFLTDCNNNLKKFLHKRSTDTLKQEGAVDKQGQVKLDTGSIWLSERVLERLFELIETDGNVSSEKFKRFVNGKVRLSFYADIIFPLADNAVFEDYMKETPENIFSGELYYCRKKIWDAVSQFSLKVNLLKSADFLHFGTLNEIQKLFCCCIDGFEHLEWSRLINTNCRLENITVNNSVINRDVVVGNNSYVVNSRLSGNTKIGENSIIYGISSKSSVIPSNVIVDGFKLSDGKYTARIIGRSDNPKLTDKENGTFLGLPLETVIERLDLTENDVWGVGQRHDLWNARLFCKCETAQQALDCAIALYDSVVNEKPLEHALELSFNSSAEQADIDEMLNDKAFIYDEVVALNIIDLIKNRVPASTIKEDYGKTISSRVIDKLCCLAEAFDEPLKIRVLYYCSRLCDNDLSGKLKEAYLNELREWLINIYMEQSNFSRDKAEPYARCELPLRVNWGGTWTDTPPYSYENGGAVLNAAILLDDGYPIKTEIKKIDKKQIVLESLDAKAVRVFKNINELRQCTDPEDPFALSKACLIAAGIVPRSGGDFNEIIDNTGGFRLTTEVKNVAQGSGLGISSILACSCLNVLYRFLGVDYDTDKLFNATLCAEQLMTTGGGWQDQAGGFLKGIKLISTLAYDKHFNVKALDLTQEVKNELQSRFVLINTGKNRLARDVLRSVVEGYIGADKDAFEALSEIEKLPEGMIRALENGSVDRFAELLTTQYELTCKMNKSFTTEHIEKILNICNPFIAGKMVCGAGGGGFIQVILKKGVGIDELSAHLNKTLKDNRTVIRNCKFLFK